jgi:hypothetical protein
MEVKNSVVPHQEQIAGLLEPGHEAYGIYSAAMFAADPEMSTHRAAGLAGQLNRETAAPKRASRDQT